jgi:cobalt-zinc-cadmium resistance protein CzcA
MIESILRLAIAKRYLMMLLAAFVMALGIWQFQYLNIDAVPDITNVQVQINTEAHGYSPLEVEQRITYPVENALAGLPKLSYSRSLSRYGLSQVTLVFDEGTDIYFARNLINERLSLINNELPNGIESQMGPISTGLGEIYMYTVSASEDASGKAFDAMALREIQDWIIKPQLARVKGVVEVNSIGGFSKQYHINPIPQRLLQYAISSEDIVEALERNNSNRGAGFIEQNGQQLLVRSAAQLENVDDIAAVIITEKDNVPIRIADVADVVIGKELRTGAATQDGVETVLGTAMMLMGENSQAVAQAVAEKLEAIKNTLPDGVVITSVYDRTALVDKAVTTVSKNLLEGALLVIVVLFLLLGNLRAAFITAMVIPLSMLATITGMVKKGVSANLMSLGALDFGLIVDGAVIIVENAIRRLAEAQKRNGQLLLTERLELVYRATAEVIKPSLFGVAIITLVYIPLFSLTGVEGKMFQPMAATVVMALLAAMLLSLTVVPAAVALFIKGEVKEKQGFVIVAAKKLYAPLLAVALRFRKTILVIALMLLLLALYLASKLGAEFVPQLNEGDIALHAMRIEGTGLEQSLQMQKHVEQTLLGFAEVKTVFARLGTAEVASDPMPPNVADSFVMLKPRENWPNPDKEKQQLISEMEAALKKLPGNNYEFTQPIQMRFNELISGVRADVAVKIFGDDLSQLQQSANKVLQIMRQVPGVADARVEQIGGLATLTISPKRTALGRYGLSVIDLQDFLARVVAGEKAGVIYQGDRRFDLVLRFSDQLRMDVDALAYLPLPLADGAYVPLEEVADIFYEKKPAQVSRENGKRRVVVSANVRGRDLASFVHELEQDLDSKLNLPVGYWLDFGGTFEQLESASQRLLVVVPITLQLLLLMLLLAFGSLKDALIIFSAVPLALTGGVFALVLRDMPFSISAGVGFIALSGIAVLNGLVMLSMMKTLWSEHYDLQAAVFQAALTRLRPVLMTALVAGLGFVPMAFNTGIGAEVQRPLATVVIGGIISATLLTLFILPILFAWLHEAEQIDRRVGEKGCDKSDEENGEERGEG